MRSSAAPQARVVSVKAAMNCMTQVSVDDGQLGQLIDDPLLLRALMRRRFFFPGTRTKREVKPSRWRNINQPGRR